MFNVDCIKVFLYYLPVLLLFWHSFVDQSNLGAADFGHRWLHLNIDKRALSKPDVLKENIWGTSACCANVMWRGDCVMRRLVDVFSWELKCNFMVKMMSRNVTFSFVKMQTWKPHRPNSWPLKWATQRFSVAAIRLEIVGILPLNLCAFMLRTF